MIIGSRSCGGRSSRSPPLYVSTHRLLPDSARSGCQPHWLTSSFAAAVERGGAVRGRDCVPWECDREGGLANELL